MCQLIVNEEINTIDDLKMEISRSIWQQEGRFDAEMICDSVKKIPINIPNCTDRTILDTINTILGVFRATNHLISFNGKYTYI